MRCGRIASATILILVAGLSPLCPLTSFAIPLEDFTGYSQGLGRGGDVVVNFAVLPPGDSFLNLLSDSFRPGTGATNLDSHQFSISSRIIQDQEYLISYYLIP